MIAFTSHRAVRTSCNHLFAIPTSFSAHRSCSVTLPTRHPPGIPFLPCAFHLAQPTALDGPRNTHRHSLIRLLRLTVCGRPVHYRIRRHDDRQQEQHASQGSQWAVPASGYSKVSVSSWPHSVEPLRPLAVAWLGAAHTLHLLYAEAQEGNSCIWGATDARPTFKLCSQSSLFWLARSRQPTCLGSAVVALRLRVSLLAPAFSP